MTDKMVEIDGEIMAKTDLAILLNDGDVEEWLPESQIKYDGDVGDTITVDVPEWLAFDTGFI